MNLRINRDNIETITHRTTDHGGQSIIEVITKDGHAVAYETLVKRSGRLRLTVTVDGATWFSQSYTPGRKDDDVRGFAEAKAELYDLLAEDETDAFDVRHANAIAAARELFGDPSY